MVALILPLTSNKNEAVYDSTVGVISRLLQSDVAKAGDPQRASEILVRVVKREHLPSHLLPGAFAVEFPLLQQIGDKGRLGFDQSFNFIIRRTAPVLIQFGL